jgi:cysteine desulfurase
MKVYLDNAATTMPSKKVKKEINDFLNTSYGNPSSLHDLGIISERRIKKAKKTIARDLNCSSNDVVFTSGGTESNNLAIIGYALKNRSKGNHVITTAYEHKSVLNAFKYLESIGFNVTYLSVDSQGEINQEDLKNKLTDETILVSIMHINNEVGRINPVQNYGKIIKDYNKKITFHVDGVQSFGKFEIDLKNIDMYSFSAHKIHGIKGIGGLYLKKGISINNIHFGGQQEKGIRPGTENLLGIVSLNVALEEAIEMRERNLNHVRKLKEKLSKFIVENIKDSKINVNSQDASPYILSVSFKDMMSEVLLHDLESKNIFVSTGSACNSKNKSVSYVLESMNLEEDYIGGTIRFSFSKNNTMKEIDFVCKSLEESIINIRKIIQRR